MASVAGTVPTRLLVHYFLGDDMADDLSKRGPKDQSRVNVNEPWEVRYWCTTFKCTEAQLKAAVKAVGPMAAAVAKQLGN